MLLELAGPYTFVPVDGLPLLWDAPERAARGVYLWCVPYAGVLLVNYVGKAGGMGGLGARLWTEHKDWEKGRYCVPVDIHDFKLGVRRVPPGPLTPEHLAEQLRELRPLFRVLLVPLASDKDCRMVESTLVSRLRRDPVTFQYLANLDKERAYKREEQVEFAEGSPAVIGLTEEIPEGLRAAAERAAR